jgi:hypothetical protein
MTPTVYFPPDPVDPSATRVFPKAELEATPAVTADVQDGPFELEGSTIVPMDSSHRVSQLSELEGSSRFSNRVSAMTTINGNRWSAVSSLSPSPLPSPPAKAAATAGVVPGAADLQIITQQHYGCTSLPRVDYLRWVRPTMSSVRPRVQVARRRVMRMIVHSSAALSDSNEVVTCRCEQ